MDKTKKHLSVGSSGIVALIVLCLAVFSFFYELFSINIDFMNPIVTLINDSNGFLTVICISFIITKVVKGASLDGIISIFSLNIVLLNRLYSNKTWAKIYDTLSSLNRFRTAFFIALCIISFYLFPKLKAWMEQQRERDSSNTKRQHRKDTAANHDNKALQSDDAETNNEKSAPNPKVRIKNEYVKKESIIIPLILAMLTALLVFIAMFFWAKEKGILEITLPSFLSTWSDLGYIACAVVAGIVAVIVFCIAKKINVENFNLTAFLALLTVIVAVYVANEADIRNLSDTLFSHLTNDMFSFIVYGSILFMVFQIGWTVFLDLFTNNKSDITSTLTGKIEKIEKDIVKLACGLVSGCLDLFQFIPSFFDTIGVLLLGNPPKAETNEDENKQSNDQHNDK